MAIQYIKYNANIYFQFDDVTLQTQVIVKSDVQNQKALVQAQIDAARDVTNAVLIDWAKQNYPSYVDLTALKAERDRLNALLDNLK